MAPKRRRESPVLDDEVEDAGSLAALSDAASAVLGGGSDHDDNVEAASAARPTALNSALSHLTSSIAAHKPAHHGVRFSQEVRFSKKPDVIIDAGVAEDEADGAVFGGAAVAESLQATHGTASANSIVEPPQSNLVGNADVSVPAHTKLHASTAPQHQAAVAAAASRSAASSIVSVGQRDGWGGAELAGSTKALPASSEAFTHAPAAAWRASAGTQSSGKVSPRVENGDLPRSAVGGTAVAASTIRASPSPASTPPSSPSDRDSNDENHDDHDEEQAIDDEAQRLMTRKIARALSPARSRRSRRGSHDDDEVADGHVEHARSCSERDGGDAAGAASLSEHDQAISNRRRTAATIGAVQQSAGASGVVSGMVGPGAASHHNGKHLEDVGRTDTLNLRESSADRRSHLRDAGAHRHQYVASSSSRSDGRSVGFQSLTYDADDDEDDRDDGDDADGDGMANIDVDADDSVSVAYWRSRKHAAASSSIASSPSRGAAFQRSGSVGQRGTRSSAMLRQRSRSVSPKPALALTSLLAPVSASSKATGAASNSASSKHRLASHKARHSGAHAQSSNYKRAGKHSRSNGRLSLDLGSDARDGTAGPGRNPRSSGRDSDDHEHGHDDGHSVSAGFLTDYYNREVVGRGAAGVGASAGFLSGNNSLGGPSVYAGAASVAPSIASLGFSLPSAGRHHHVPVDSAFAGHAGEVVAATESHVTTGSNGRLQQRQQLAMHAGAGDSAGGVHNWEMSQLSDLASLASAAASDDSDAGSHGGGARGVHAKHQQHHRSGNMHRNSIGGPRYDAGAAAGNVDTNASSEPKLQRSAAGPSEIHGQLNPASQLLLPSAVPKARTRWQTTVANAVLLGTATLDDDGGASGPHVPMGPMHLLVNTSPGLAIGAATAARLGSATAAAADAEKHFDASVGKPGKASTKGLLLPGISILHDDSPADVSGHGQISTAELGAISDSTAAGAAGSTQFSSQQQYQLGMSSTTQPRMPRQQAEAALELLKRQELRCLADISSLEQLRDRVQSDPTAVAQDVAAAVSDLGLHAQGVLDAASAAQAEVLAVHYGPLLHLQRQRKPTAPLLDVAPPTASGRSSGAPASPGLVPITDADLDRLIHTPPLFVRLAEVLNVTNPEGPANQLLQSGLPALYPAAPASASASSSSAATAGVHGYKYPRAPLELPSRILVALQPLHQLL